MISHIRLNEEEKAQINEVYKGVIADIDSLCQKGQIRKLRVDAHSYTTFFKDRYYKYTNANLVINGNSISLSSASSKKSVDLRTVQNVYQKLEFILEYGSIRNRIINQINVSSEHKTHIAKTIKSDDAIVEMELPESINQNVIEVTKEDGRIVGTIDFGGKLVRIVTDGNIVLEDRTKEEKQKNKG